MKIISFRAKSELPETPTLDIGGRQVPVIVRRHPNAKGYRLRFDAVGQELRLTMPSRGSARAALHWAAEQRDWIAQQLASAAGAVPLVPGVRVPVEGVEREILWDRSSARSPRLQDSALVVGGPQESVGARVVRWLKGRARFVVGGTSSCQPSGSPGHLIGLELLDRAGSGLPRPASRM
ncbi:MAG: hypothetical protein LKM31_06500 [Sphingobium sp.]|nr:hypothetical protein [Sphingobium sp.]